MPEATSESLTCQPPIEVWFDELSKNSKIPRPFSLKSSVLEEALLFESSLAAIAQVRGIPWSAPTMAQSDLVAMTGHQPLVYHAGIFEKNRLLSQFCKTNNVTGINVIIDTDIEDCGLIQFPHQGKLERIHIGSGAALIFNQTIKPFTATSEIQSLNRALELYRKLVGTPVSIANTVVRAQFEHNRCYLNVPFSQIASTDAAQDFFRSLINRGESLHNLYNSALAQYREARKIKNAANPFPDLKKSPSSYELPFWAVNFKSGARSALESSRHLASDERIIPRGAMVTLFLRVCCSDWFIHGLGGAKYDQFTDQLIDKLFSISATSYATVSATRLLFTKERAIYEEALAWREKLTSISSHIDEYLGKEVFESATEATLQDLSKKRPQLLSALKAGKENRLDVKNIAIELKALDSKMKEIISGDAKMLDRLKPLDVDPKLVQLWYSREFPFFLHNTA